MPPSKRRANAKKRCAEKRDAEAHVLEAPTSPPHDVRGEDSVEQPTEEVDGSELIERQLDDVETTADDFDVAGFGSSPEQYVL